MIPRDQVRTALQRVKDALIDAAGADKRLSKRDLEAKLETLAPTERAAVDAFAQELFQREKKNGVVTVATIESVAAGALRKLAPKSGPAELDVDTLAAARTFGASLVSLAQRLAGAPASALPALPRARLRGLEGDALVRALRELCLPHVQLSYGTARDVMYGYVDAHDGLVRDVYTGREVPSVPRAQMADVNQVNAEHTFPKSQGVQETAALSDLHHLFPTDILANGKRSSLPFGDVVTVVWEKNGCKLGTDKSGALVFEPPDEQKGDTARALFYVAAMYGLAIDDHEERAMRRWNRGDRVDDRERARNDAIASVQENRNPFVDDPSLIGRVDDF